MSIIFEGRQLEAIKGAEKWFREGNKQVYTIAGYAGCLDENTLILTNKGSIPLGEIIDMQLDSRNFKGFKEFTKKLKVYNGKKFVDVSHIYATDNMNGYYIKTKSGLELVCSEIHPLLTIEDGVYKWVKANELKEGTYIATLGNKNIFKESVIDYSKDLEYYYMGYYIADGYIHNGKNICFTSKKKDRLKKLLSYIKENYSYNGTEHFTESKGNYTFRFVSEEFIELVRDIGLDVKNKSALRVVNKLDTPNKKIQFIRGMLNDISISKTGNIEYTNSLKENTDFIKILMREFGVIWTEGKPKNTRSGKLSYRLYLCFESLERLYRLVGNLTGSKSEISLKDIVETRGSKVNNTNKNLVPNMEKHFIKFNNKGQPLKASSLYDYRYKRRRPSYKALDNFKKYYSDTEFNEILEDRYYWDEIIEKKQVHQKFYDITVPDGNSFVSNSIISHNTGKSTIVNAIVNNLGITNNTTFATFTGKASLVLNRKGNPAQTLHRLMYVIEEDLSYAGYTKLVFRKRDFIDPSIKLIVVDEISMVDSELMRDLLSFGVPIIALGDPGQLPPVKGDSNGYLDNPDVFLEEIHRQAAGNPIIYLSMLARQGKKIEMGKYGTNVLVVSPDQITDSAMRRLGTKGQIICGYNRSRTAINSRVRQMLGFESDLPEIGDKVICTRNNWMEAVEGTPLINGTIGEVTGVGGINRRENKLLLSFQPDFANTSYIDLECDTQEFLNVPKDKVIRNDYNKFDYGYAITCHKSQGAEFDDVLLFEEILNPEMHSRWFYTGITRAAKTLVIASQQRRYW